MKLYFLTVALLCLFYTVSVAQNIYTVKGSVVDTVSNGRLINTSVSILRSKDSTLVKFTRADENGTFTFSQLPKGKLFLLVTYPGYADYVEQFDLDSTKSKIDFGRIKLTLRATLLQNVIIKGTAAAIKMKGDTTEFNAAAYKIQPNSKVEDLLKQLPGIQVDKDGKITAQGQTVNKVLVDGEEFFGDDPTLVTKNLRADMVDKVQLYDKRSDQAAFTGIDDGKKDKTINIKLKDDKKTGYFGKLDAGVGTDDYYQAQGMVNYFKGKKKFSAYGTLANTGKIGLGWQDNSKYSPLDLEMSDGGGFYINSGSNDALDTYDGQYNDQGIPIARNAGSHYDAKWNSDKESINANYKIGSLNVDGIKNSLTQNNLPTGIFNTNTDESFNNYMFRQKLDAAYQIKLDTSSTLKISVDGTAKNSQTRSSFDSKSIRGNNILLNESQRNLSNDGDDKLFNAKVLWTKKLKKPRRTLSINLTQAITQTETKGFLKSDNEYYNAEGISDSSTVLDQYKTSLVKSSAFNSNIVYTEPLTKRISLVLNYGFGINNSSANRKSFNPSGNGTYGILDTAFSNNYKLDQISNQGGVIFNYKSNKTTLNFGTKVANVSFDQKNLYDNTSFERNFLNWRPQVNYTYQFDAQKRLSLSYNGYTNQPSIDQIQPVRINNDPLNIVLGNPDLKPSFQNSFSLNYYSYKVISGRSVYAYVNYGTTANPIVSNVTTDSAGKSTLRYTNLAHKSSNYLNAYIAADQKIKALDMNAGLSLNVNSNTSYNYINDVLNRIQSTTYSGKVNLYKSTEKKYFVYANFGPTYTTNESSLQKQTNDNGWGLNGSGGFTIYLPGKFEIGSSTEYEYRAKTQSFDTDFSRVILNANIAKKFMKSEGLKFTLSGNDLLNQNVGFRRTASGNMITQNSYTTIKRYFMASISWDFSKMGGATTKK